MNFTNFTNYLIRMAIRIIRVIRSIEKYAVRNENIDDEVSEARCIRGTVDARLLYGGV